MRIVFLTILIGISAISCRHAEGESSLVEVAQFGKSMAIGLSVNSENRIFTSFPNSDGDGHLALAEIKDGILHAYPDSAWNNNGDYQSHFLRVQDVYVDHEDFLWVLDSKPGSSKNIFGDGAGDASGLFKLVKINTHTNLVEDVFLFEDLDKSKSALNDVRIDTEKKLAYLSDPGLASIVVLDLQTKKSRSVLANTPYTLSEDRTLIYDGVKMEDEQGHRFSSHVNSLALTADFKYLYFKPINQEHLYRIETRYLTEAKWIDLDLQAQVEDLGKVGITHGMIADTRGNVYFASSEDFALKYITPDGVLKTLIEDPDLIWPDSFGIGTDNFLYFTCAQLQRLPQWNDGKDQTAYPYRAFKVKLP